MIDLTKHGNENSVSIFEAIKNMILRINFRLVKRIVKFALYIFSIFISYGLITLFGYWFGITIEPDDPVLYTFGGKYILAFIMGAVLLVAAVLVLGTIGMGIYSLWKATGERDE